MLTKMREVVNTKEKVSRSTDNEKGYGSFMALHISYNKDNYMIHDNRHWKMQITLVTIEILIQFGQNT